MALLNEINVKGVPHPIVTDDGYYEEMTVGDAEGEWEGSEMKH